MMLALLVSLASAATLSLSSPSFTGGSATPISADPVAFRAAEVEGLTRAGLSLAADADAAAKADYRVEAVVSDTNVRYKSPREVEVVVDWRVAERASGELVYAVQTRGYVKAEGTELKELGLQAFQGAVASFAGRPKLAEVLARTPSAEAPDRTLRMKACDQPPLKLPGQLTDAFESVVVVKAADGVGTGVVVSPDGFVLTAAHVVPKGAALTVTTHGGRTLPAELVRRDTTQDVALLHVVDLPRTCAPMQVAGSEIGTDLFIIGTPAGLDYSVSKGVVSGLRTLDEYRFLQTDASISPGNSGGPMLDVSGAVVAIVSWKIQAAGFEGLGFGVPARAVFDRLALRYDVASDTTFAAFPDGSPLALDPAVVDTPDSSQLEASAKAAAAVELNDKRRKKGIIFVGVGAALALSTGYYAGTLDHASDPLWGTLVLTNTVGWAGVLGGGALIGLSFAPLAAEAPPMLTVGRAF